MSVMYDIKKREYDGKYNVWVWTELVLNKFQLEPLSTRWINIGVASNYNKANYIIKEFFKKKLNHYKDYKKKETK
jgi:hypothetical protein|tara:strand:+ start:1319 stop:1543 length:225 start_codon:yes stop_codon:yes gene_type:complete